MPDNSYHDGCAPLFELGEAYRRGLLHYEKVRANIQGRIACHRETVGVIAQVCWNCEGEHLEIGTLFGGTAIVAAMARADKQVTCIDPLDGYYGLKKDPMAKIVPSVEAVKANLEYFKVADRVTVIPAKSDPFPVPPQARYDSALIDGDHTYEGASMDWSNVRAVVDKYVIFDNLDKKHPGVVRVFVEACNDPNWRPVLIYDICGVVQYVSHR